MEPKPIKFEFECGAKFEVADPPQVEVLSEDDAGNLIPGATFIADCPNCGSECGSEDNMGQ